ncbi:hypothetical protein BC832DRAFT_560836 [Gaertneriomyces semiglobifer]|nr:hypothetical protein BC832DRAFT_560836 [Gaertneriomyces semiglobifer]
MPGWLVWVPCLGGALFGMPCPGALFVALFVALSLDVACGLGCGLVSWLVFFGLCGRQAACLVGSLLGRQAS